ncbi:hypothetical protein RB598_006459 [Gaeumannomyces tritici]
MHKIPPWVQHHGGLAPHLTVTAPDPVSRSTFVGIATASRSGPSPTFTMPLSHMLFNLFSVALLGGVSLPGAHAAGSIPSRRITEYQLPVATETHEFARVPGTDLLVLSQMSNSHLVKIQLDPKTEQPLDLRSFPMGKDDKSGLHGMWPSEKRPGLVWMSLQWENKLLLVDAGRKSLEEKPTVVTTIDIPQPGNGPHCVFEIKGRVWAGLKVASKQDGGYYVFSSDLDGGNPKLYPSLNSPVFIKEDPSTGLIYVTQDAASSIMRINVTSGETAQLPIPPAVGNNPVGMTTIEFGPLRGVWFSLAGNATGGTATFGRVVSETGALRFFSLKKPAEIGRKAGLLHVADATTKEAGPGLWLLSTSLLSNSSGDALIRVALDDAVSAIKGEEYNALPTQNAMSHRIVVLNSTVLVSELHTFTLAQLSYENTVAGKWLPDQGTASSSSYGKPGKRQASGKWRDL